MMQLVIQRNKLFFGIALEKYIPVALALYLFAIPVNNTLQSITFVLAVILILTQRTTLTRFSHLLREPWVAAIGAFYLLVLLACLWSPATPSDAFYVVKKYSKLLFLPWLAIGFADQKSREAGIAAFLIAMTLTCALSFVKALYPGLFANQTPGFVFRNYIMTGHMTAFASYIALYLTFHPPKAENDKSKWQNRVRSPWVFGVLFVMFSIQLLFLSLGRTGYVVYFLLMALFLLQTLPKKQLLLAGFAFIFSAALLLDFSPKMQQGFNQAYQNWSHYQQGDKDTSVGFRLQFQQFAWKLFKQSPWIGHGTGSYTAFFKKDKPVPAWPGDLREPHNQYLLILAEYGVLGFAFYCALLLALMQTCWRLHAMKPLAFAVFVPFLVGCLSDSLLFYSASGYFVLAFLALCLGERVAEKDTL